MSGPTPVESVSGQDPVYPPPSTSGAGPSNPNPPPPSAQQPGYPPPGAYPPAPPPAYPPKYDNGQGAPGYGNAPPPPQYNQGPPPAYSRNGPQVYGPPPPAPPAHVTVVQQYQGRTGFGEHPVSMQCPRCQANITTTTESSVGTMVWVVVGVIILIGLFVFPFILLGCCFIPCCIPSLKDVAHSCPNCNTFLGKYNRMS